MRNIFIKHSLLACFVLLGLEVYSQEHSSINHQGIDELRAFSMESFTDEFILIHKNEVLAHWKNSNCDSSYFNTASMLKSWTSLVIGIMIDEGLIKSEKDLDCDYLPDWKDGCKNDVTVEHLLTMSAGINKKRGANGILAEDDMNAYVLKLRLDTMPNIRFSYSNASVQLLGVLIERVSVKRPVAILRKYFSSLSEWIQPVWQKTLRAMM